MRLSHCYLLRSQGKTKQQLVHSRHNKFNYRAVTIEGCPPDVKNGLENGLSHGSYYWLKKLVMNSTCQGFFALIFTLILYVDNVANAGDEAWPDVSQMEFQDFSELEQGRRQCFGYALGQVDFTEIFPGFEGVPALSAWPIVILVMLLLAGGIYILNRRRRVTA